jgi:plasmid stability protein
MSGRRRSGPEPRDVAAEPEWNQNGAILEGSRMPATITLKNIPDVLYERLKLQAQVHRRSINSEAIVCLEAALSPKAIDPAEHIARARAIHAELGGRKFKASDIDRFKREGRK